MLSVVTQGPMDLFWFPDVSTAVTFGNLRYDMANYEKSRKITFIDFVLFRGLP